MNTAITTISWPPSYLVKKHRRAKYVKLRTKMPHGLIVTIPYRFNVKEIPAILEENKAWIIQQLLRLQTKSATVLPDKIALPALNEMWLIHYLKSTAKLQLIARPGYELVLIGNTDDIVRVRKKLIDWLKIKAQEYLLIQLQKCSGECGLAFNQMSIRDQSTIWGSCTVRKNISLSYKLILLPYELMRYVLIHELCHTKYLNHSKAFWQLVAKFDPNYQAHRRLLHQAADDLPNWLII